MKNLTLIFTLIVLVLGAFVFTTSVRIEILNVSGRVLHAAEGSPAGRHIR